MITQRTNLRYILSLRNHFSNKDCVKRLPSVKFSSKNEIVHDEDFLPIRPTWEVSSLLEPSSLSKKDSALTDVDIDKLILLSRLKPLERAKKEALVKDLQQIDIFLSSLKSLDLSKFEPLSKIEENKTFTLDLSEQKPENTLETKDFSANNLTAHSTNTKQGYFVVPSKV